MNEGHGKTALVTGASSGIGKAFAELLAEKGYALVLTARRRDRLEALAAALAQRHKVDTHIIVADLAETGAASAIASELRHKNLTVDFLVNNAGYGVPGSYTNVTWADHSRFMQVMVTAVLDLTYLLLPGMVERGWGRIVNIASVAGIVPAPAGHTLYGASKAFLIRFSEALAAENMQRGVNVTAVCPGFTWSEFHDVTGTRERMNKVPGIMWLTAPRVAREGYDAVMRGNPLIVNGRIYQFLVWLNGVMPRRFGRWVSGRFGQQYRKT
ncbi:MAG TPA: SDR family oxidoreductase [Vicinamibacterales bacterium]|nr:SDR family oxidoreductase [Vicinamibacterales bacterium]